jgi:hypothetical protein
LIFSLVATRVFVESIDQSINRSINQSINHRQPSNPFIDIDDYDDGGDDYEVEF